jgi:hypothetical protein
MKSITEYYRMLHEMSFPRKDVESEITALSHPILEHVIKILTFDNQLDYKKHIVDMTNWLLYVQRLKIKGNKRPKQKNYYMWLFKETIESVKVVDTWIEYGMTDLHKYQRLRKSDEVYEVMTDMFKRISKDMSVNNFKTIVDYLP